MNAPDSNAPLLTEKILTMGTIWAVLSLSLAGWLSRKISFPLTREPSGLLNVPVRLVAKAGNSTAAQSASTVVNNRRAITFLELLTSRLLELRRPYRGN